jgi:hypothetical protein
MTVQMEISFADWVSAREVDVALDLIQTFGITLHQDRRLRMLTLVPAPGELETLKEYLAAWETDHALSWSDVG